MSYKFKCQIFFAFIFICFLFSVPLLSKEIYKSSDLGYPEYKIVWHLSEKESRSTEKTELAGYDADDKMAVKIEYLTSKVSTEHSTKMIFYHSNGKKEAEYLNSTEKNGNEYIYITLYDLKNKKIIHEYKYDTINEVSIYNKWNFHNVSQKFKDEQEKTNFKQEKILRVNVLNHEIGDFFKILIKILKSRTGSRDNKIIGRWEVIIKEGKSIEKSIAQIDQNTIIFESDRVGSYKYDIKNDLLYIYDNSSVPDIKKIIFNSEDEFYVPELNSKFIRLQ